MKAIVYTKYGSPDVLEFKEVEIPAPRENEVLIKTEAASLNAADWHLLRADPLSEVADAIRYLEEGHAKGKVVININNFIK